MRNIVLITFDSLRADHCSFMGYKRETTPTLDKMARNGLYFENAMASGVATAPSMMGAFTGNYALTDSRDYTGEHWRKDMAPRKTLAQVLSKKGYNTGSFNANIFATSHFGINKGFEHNYDPLSKEIDEKAGTKLYQKIFSFLPKKAEPEAFILTPNKYFSNINEWFAALKTIMKKERLCTPWEKLYDPIIDWTEKIEEPYLLWILLIDTHVPWMAPKRWRDTLVKQFYLNYKILYSSSDKCIKFNEKERKQTINIYDDSICYADKFVDKLWIDLKEDNPIFIIHADHGDGFGEHGFYEHPPMLYEELIHVPLVIYNAGIKGKIEEPVSLLGLSPSILELIGEENEFSSESFLNGGKGWIVSKVLDKGKRKVAVRMKNWKLITGQKNEDELYDLKQDPNEQENLINGHPKLVEEMRKIVESHVKQEMMARERRRVNMNLTLPR